MKIYEMLKRRALVSRGAAQAVVAALRSELQSDSATIELDFSGIEAVTPSFVDELISQLTSPGIGSHERVVFTAPPSRLSEKFRAIGRGRGVSFEETPTHQWVITLSPYTQHQE